MSIGRKYTAEYTRNTLIESKLVQIDANNK